MPRAPRLPLEGKVPVKSHLEKEVKDVCAYCGAPFAHGEITIEREIHGRTWRFCSQHCYQEFMVAVHFEDEDLDSYDNVVVQQDDKQEDS